MEKRTAVSSRFYRALYRKLGDNQLSARTGQQVGVVMGVALSDYHFLGNVSEFII